MIVIECAQGSEEWTQARTGAVTASMFCVARERVGELDARQRSYVAAVIAGVPEKLALENAGYKAKPTADSIRRALAGEQVGDWSDAAKNYAFRLAVERISGTPLDEGYQTWQMQRGQEMEPDARMEHEMQTGLFIQRAGFVTTDDGKFGASADGLIDPDGGSEYKCLVSPERMRNVLLSDDISEFADQIQGCMWITGRKWWHFCLYCPALAPIGKQLYWREVKRDDDYIEAMELDLLRFSGLVDQYEGMLRLKEAA